MRSTKNKAQPPTDTRLGASLGLDSVGAAGRETSEVAGSEDPRLVAAVREYMAELEAGTRPNRKDFLARHADIAADLAACLDGLAFVHSAAAEMNADRSTAPAGAEPRLDAGEPDVATGKPLGDFQLIREIGRGGMGVVYEAVQLSLGRKVAVKVLPLASAFDSRHLQRFHNEAQAAAQLHHTNIVPVYAVGSERGVHFYAMQLIEGQSLEDVVRDLRRAGRTHEEVSRGGGDATVSWNPAAKRQASVETSPEVGGTLLRQQSPVASRSIVGSSAESLTTQRTSKRSNYYRTVAKLGLQAADALEYAHQFGVVHRDIKPGNLLLDFRGNLWITDFGLAQFYAESELTRTGDLLGTLRYMSPEQAAGKAVVLDQRTDVYSLAVTVYELLTLERALPGETRGELLHQIGSVDPRSPRSIDRNIPQELETIVMKAASKDPADRYASAGAMADDLRRFLHDEPILARPPSLWDKTVKWTRRHKSMAVSAVVVLVLALVGLSISTVIIAREQGKTRTALDRERERAAEANAQRALADRRYRQAREAVDFFTKVAAEELADNLQSAEVRKEMLEAALRYYQGLLEEGGADASRSAELAAARKNANDIFTELSAFLRFTHATAPERLLNESSVMAELGLSKQQASQASAALRQLWESLRDIGPMTPEERREGFNKLADDANAALDAQITPGKAERLRQIHRQVRGPHAFSDPEVVARLDLTPAQRERVKAVQLEYRESFGALFRSVASKKGGDVLVPSGALTNGSPRGSGGSREGREGPPPDWEKRKADVVALRTVAVEQIVNQLTRSQAAEWQAMAGEPFNGNVIVPPFGGPWFGRWLSRGPGGSAGGGPRDRDDRGSRGDRGRPNGDRRSHP